MVPVVIVTLVDGVVPVVIVTLVDGVLVPVVIVTLVLLSYTGPWDTHLWCSRNALGP